MYDWALDEGLPFKVAESKKFTKIFQSNCIFISIKNYLLIFNNGYIYRITICFKIADFKENYPGVTSSTLNDRLKKDCEDSIKKIRNCLSRINYLSLTLDAFKYKKEEYLFSTAHWVRRILVLALDWLYAIT